MPNLIAYTGGHLLRANRAVGPIGINHLLIGLPVTGTYRCKVVDTHPRFFPDDEDAETDIASFWDGNSYWTGYSSYSPGMELNGYHSLRNPDMVIGPWFGYFYAQLVQVRMPTGNLDMSRLDRILVRDSSYGLYYATSNDTFASRGYQSMLADMKGGLADSSAQGYVRIDPSAVHVAQGAGYLNIFVWRQRSRGTTMPVVDAGMIVLTFT